MQIDIKTTQVTQLRQTFSNVARRIGGDKPASRYQEATFDLQPAVNFHYRPFWQPQYEIYDKRRTAIQMADWYAFKDPRQYYYGSYTVARARQQDAMERNLEFVEKRGLLAKLPQEARAQIAFLMVPLRHLEWGANTNNCYITAYGWGAAITQATMFNTMDRLGIAQYLTRVGLLLDGNTGESLQQAKRDWLEHPAWQGVRCVVENMMVVEDWFELLIAQNLVCDGLVYPLVHRSFDENIAAEHGPALAMIQEFMVNWFDETSRWVDATVKTAAAESKANAGLLAQWAAHWKTLITEALAPLATEALGAGAQEALAAATRNLDARVAKLGLAV